MIKVSKFTNGMIRENCYIVENDNAEAIIIDPGNSFKKIIEYIKFNKLEVVGILLTHGHFDHIWDCKKLQSCGYKVYIHELDADKCGDNHLNLSGTKSSLETFTPDVLFTDYEYNIKLGHFKINVLLTPGHSKGSCTYFIDKYMFTGDTLFNNTYGRTDFYDGNEAEMQNSLSKLSVYLYNEYILCPGHDI